jgi:SnoaL-like protein
LTRGRTPADGDARRKRAARRADHGSLGPSEGADRLAIRGLFDAYAHCADRHDAEGQKALFTVDSRFAAFMSGEGTEPTYVIEGREALTPVFVELNQYEATTHFNGQSTIDLYGDHATGESCTIPHHLFTADGERRIMTAALRYLDSFVKIKGTWFFEERNLILDWSKTRTSTP